MNYDRFLTRVFDKQEKKMYYIGDKLPKSLFPEYENVRLVSISNIGLMVSVYAKNVKTPYPLITCICYIEFEDRFIPMLCIGRKSKDGKLVYADDIVSPAPGSKIFKNEDCINWIGTIECSQDDNYLMKWFIMGFAAWPIEECVIRGNKWEHPELWEENK